jgi:two-component system, sensor histidine kinase and response regulator
MAEEEKVLDIDGVMDRLEGDYGLYAEIVALFNDGVAESLRTLREAAVKKDAATFGRVAHATKGALGNIGAMRAWRKAYELECAGRDQQLDSGVQLVTELESEIDSFRAEYEKYRAATAH